MCDVALDPYTSHGHDGLLKSDYVLDDFNYSEQKIIEKVFASSEKAIYEIILNGFSSAMGKFNQ